ncbi:hypothetical protein [Pseudonocardia sp. TRM90224]|uniref:hypothetical protein n=1 Tax=Pseudonocardia sp. TRM90224 TaxID=2812678 RepID=UPI001E2986B3|nr:hypothetical protein [Pseudonocardia sp. TRM90224]
MLRAAINGDLPNDREAIVNDHVRRAASSAPSATNVVIMDVSRIARRPGRGEGRKATLQPSQGRKVAFLPSRPEAGVEIVGHASTDQWSS